VIKTFRSTGIGNEASFDEETAEEWRRKKEETRCLLEQNRKLDGRQSAPLAERHGSAGDDDAGSSDL
jgi:hypothetical protein